MRGYSVGALAVLGISVGVMLIVYGGDFLPFNFFYVPAWIFTPLGAYTIFYAFVSGGDSTYYAVWGSIMFIIGLASILHTVVSPLVLIGLLIFVIVAISLATYWRKTSE